MLKQAARLPAGRSTSVFGVFFVCSSCLLAALLGSWSVGIDDRGRGKLFEVPAPPPPLTGPRPQGLEPKQEPTAASDPPPTNLINLRPRLLAPMAAPRQECLLPEGRQPGSLAPGSQPPRLVRRRAGPPAYGVDLLGDWSVPGWVFSLDRRRSHRSPAGALTNSRRWAWEGGPRI